jgi:hypothetical protein
LNAFTEDRVNSIVKEISRFIAILQGIPTDSYPSSPSAQMDFAVQFWQNYKHDLPSLAKFARYPFTVCSSSASAERSFSVLNCCFGKQQKLALEDYVSLPLVCFKLITDSVV